MHTKQGTKLTVKILREFSDLINYLQIYLTELSEIMYVHTYFDTMQNKQLSNYYNAMHNM